MNKFLFRQSLKANKMIWIFVTSITCFTLAAIILIMGSFNDNILSQSFEKHFKDKYVYAQVEKISMITYQTTQSSIKEYDKSAGQLSFLFRIIGEQKFSEIADSYETYLNEGMSDEAARNQLTDDYLVLVNRQETDAVIDYYLVMGKDISISAQRAYLKSIISSAIYDEFYGQYGEEKAEFAKTTVERALNEYLQSGEDEETFSAKFSSNLLGEVAPPLLEEYGEYSSEEIINCADSAISEFRAQVYLNPNESPQEIIERLSEEDGPELSEDLSSALEELNELDLFSLIIGEIFFKISGLLLPIVYTIMVSNNLLAKQVDSGSMAYILSTPTKRKEVVFTQICFLVTSLFGMFFCTTVVGLICMSMIDASVVTITVSQFLLFNLGSFFTMFAISGICFLASAWFNRSSQAMGIGGGIAMLFLVSAMLGLFGSVALPSIIRINAMKIFNYITIISLFDCVSILSSTTAFLWKFAILFGIGFITYFIAMLRFDKKDLPL